MFCKRISNLRSFLLLEKTWADGAFQKASPNSDWCCFIFPTTAWILRGFVRLFVVIPYNDSRLATFLKHHVTTILKKFKKSDFSVIQELLAQNLWARLRVAEERKSQLNPPSFPQKEPKTDKRTSVTVHLVGKVAGRVTLTLVSLTSLFLMTGSKFLKIFSCLERIHSFS